ncbi:hypothetical protein K435DRAFT_676202, partial [Dendrothele bispora CBS 962.96]
MDEGGIEERHFDILLTHLPRLREFHISLEFWDSSMSTWQHEMFTKPAPKLESLSIIPKTSQGSTLPSLFGGDMPRLKHLFLEHYTSWPQNHFHNLTHVCIFDQDVLSVPTTAHFLDLLDSSPLLEELAL